MLRINKRVSNELINEYIENALDYLKDYIKNNNIDFDLDKNKDNNDNIIKLISNIEFKKVYEDYFFDNSTIKDLFTHITHRKNGNEKEESIYDSFRGKTLLKYNSKKNKKNESTSINKDIDEHNTKVSKLYKDFINELDIKVCPYCGRNHIGFFELKDNKDDKTVSIVPGLDHFYPKSLYRQFSISLYNLIPACNLCNLTLKHDKQEEKLLYPYKEGFEDYVKFNLGDNSEEDLMKVVMLLTGDSNVDITNLNIRLVKDLDKIKKRQFSYFNKHEQSNSLSLRHLSVRHTSDTSPQVEALENPSSSNSFIVCGDVLDVENEDYIIKCKNSNKMFHLEEIYNSEHKQNALDLLSKIVWYRKNYIKSLNSIVSTLGDCSDLINYNFGNNQLFGLINYSNKLSNEIKSKIINSIKNNWIATQSTTARNDDYKNTDKGFVELETKIDEIFNNMSIDDFLGDNFEFLFGHWLDPENDLKEPLSKFYRDIYKQITEPHLYDLLENESRFDK